MGSKDVFALRKSGQAAEALELARAEYPDHSGDLWFLRAYGWVLYDLANKTVVDFESKRIPASALSLQLIPCLREFATIGEALRGDTTFSQMLRLATKVSKDLPEFLRFARWMGVESFSNEDRTPFVNGEGKTIDSLERRYKRAICREVISLAADPDADRQLVQWGLGIIEQALKEQPNDQWLNYYQSKLHLARGETDAAIRRLAPVLRRQPRAAWPWALLGEILEVTRPRNALTCLAHATQLAREEVEVAKTRIRLARHLAAAGRFDEGARQVALALEFRERNGFRIPEDLAQLAAADWYRQAYLSGSLRAIPDQSGAARSLLKELDRVSLTYASGVIDHINDARAFSYVATGPHTGLALKHRQFPNVVSLPPGTLLDVGRAEPDGPPLDWRLSEAAELPQLCEVRVGRLTRPEGKDFAFVEADGERIFVPPVQASAFEPGEPREVRCLAIRRANRDGKVGWRAIRFFPGELEPIL